MLIWNLYWLPIVRPMAFPISTGERGVISKACRCIYTLHLKAGSLIQLRVSLRHGVGVGRVWFGIVPETKYAKQKTCLTRHRKQATNWGKSRRKSKREACVDRRWGDKQEEIRMKGQISKSFITLMIIVFCLGSLLITALWIIVDNR